MPCSTNGSRVGSVRTASCVPIETVLETTRCWLRYPALADAPSIFAALQSPLFPSQVPLGQVESLEEVETWISRSQSDWAAGLAVSWTIECRADDALLGQVTLSRKAESDVWALAYWVHPECWGQGYATEAARRVMAFAFDRLGVAVIWAGAAAWNQASVRVLEKLGMEHVADNPQGYFIKGEPVPIQEFAISREKWRAR